MRETDAIPMLHGSVAGTVMDHLQAMGVPLRKGMHAARMPGVLTEQRDVYVPFRAACDWIDYESTRQGIEHLGLQAASRAGAQILPAPLVRKLTAVPTLYHGLLAWTDMIRIETSHARIGLQESGDDLRLCFTSTFDQDTPGQAQWIWLAELLHINVVRLFLGPDWQPEEMTVPVHGPRAAIARAIWPNTRMVQHPGVTGIAVPRSALPEPPLHSGADHSSIAGSAGLPAPPPTLVDSLSELITAYLPGGAPRVELVAEMAGTSVRTLQRLLAREHLTYAKLVSQTRYARARDLLEHSELSIGEIARELGYLHPPHFSRAFRSIAGLSPRQYRHRRDEQA